MISLGELLAFPQEHPREGLPHLLLPSGRVENNSSCHFSLSCYEEYLVPVLGCGGNILGVIMSHPASVHMVLIVSCQPFCMLCRVPEA